MGYSAIIIAFVLVLVSVQQARSETIIEEYEDRVVVQILGKPDGGFQPELPRPDAVPATASDKTLAELREQARKLQYEILKLRMPVADDTPEMKLARKTQIEELQAQLRQIVQQQTAAATTH